MWLQVSADLGVQRGRSVRKVGGVQLLPGLRPRQVWPRGGLPRRDTPFPLPRQRFQLSRPRTPHQAWDQGTNTYQPILSISFVNQEIWPSYLSHLSYSRFNLCPGRIQNN